MVFAEPVSRMESRVTFLVGNDVDGSFFVVPEFVIVVVSFASVLAESIFGVGAWNTSCPCCCGTG